MNVTTILPTFDEHQLIHVCTSCEREFCQRFGELAKKVRCLLCNLKEAELRPCSRAVNCTELLLPCTSFYRATRNPTKGCRRAIPAPNYYEHFAACGRNIAEINNPAEDLPQPVLEPPTPPEMEAAASGEENWDDDGPVPLRSMFEAIEVGMQYPDVEIALPSWAVGII